MKIVSAVMLGLSTVIAAACGGANTPPANRVFFVTPTNGATVKPMSTIEFGSSGVTVAAVPPGELKPEQVRAGTIHYHIAVDSDCLAAGTVIPKADPWVHFATVRTGSKCRLPRGP